MKIWISSLFGPISAQIKHSDKMAVGKYGVSESKQGVIVSL